ncbi:MAG: deoxyhypusine synthase [Phycisphaerae bacterium]|nr:deoxyhypusine synthase [Phycisphaerae bacterium]NUQ46022.1 deoxyhypusine synthase [Phycisphaerae bacterium]
MKGAHQRDRSSSDCPGKPRPHVGPGDTAARRGPAVQAEGPQIEPLELRGHEHVADLIDHCYGRSGFNGRRLAEACRLYSRMVGEDTTIAVTLSGAMTPIGMSGVLNSLIRAGFVDFIIATGANLYHDLHRAIDAPMYQGSFAVDDNELAEAGIARIYDVFIGERETLMETDNWILKLLRDFDFDKPFSTATLHHALGRAVREHAPHPEKSLVATAAEYDVPIYTSSPGDSSIGMNLIMPQLFGRTVQLNPMLDVIETAALVRAATRNGVVEVGGGSPKNFYLQTQPTLHQILMDPSKGGHDYFIQLTTDAPHWGGLSGATPQEARSWGKIKDATINNVVVYSCASLTFPLLAQYVLTRNKPRKPMRLFQSLEACVEALRAAAQANKELRQNLEKCGIALKSSGRDRS